MAKKKKTKHFSGIGGQAVLEGIMMKNKEQYAVAVRKPNGEIEIEVDNYQGIAHGSKIANVPFIRGVFNFIDSLNLGMKALNYSATFYEEDDTKEDETKVDETLEKVSKGHGEKLMTVLVTILSFAFAIGLFMLLPFYLTNLMKDQIRNDSLLAIAEGVVRIAIFLLYVVGIALMKDIRRVYMFHGAEHKCINCIERGRALTVKNVMKSSRMHRRCGTSFLLFVMFISVILFFFIRVDNMALKVLIRIALIPVIAGISYEILRLAGRTDNILIRIISAPGMLLQRLTTREPDEAMVEVAIASIEAVFDWKKFLIDEFGYNVDAVTELAPENETESAVSDDVNIIELGDETEEVAEEDTTVDGE